MPPRRAAVAGLIGIAILGLAAANDHAFEMLWLPAVLAGAAWSTDRSRTLRRCLRRTRERP
jgi:hypothetical protein